jgi:serine/threonine protein kinase
MVSTRFQRSDFVPVRDLSAGDQGAMNNGIVLVKHRKGYKAIEKRFHPDMIRSGWAANEVHALSRCNNTYICQYFGADLEYHKYGYGSLFMERCELGSLETVIKNFLRYDQVIPEGFLWEVLYDISLAIAYIQSGDDAEPLARQGKSLTPDMKRVGWTVMVHSDIKPANMFLTMRDAKTHLPTVVLGDFGCCINVSSNKRNGRKPLLKACTRAFAPPEAPYYSQGSDLYSMALSVHCAAMNRQMPSKDRSKARDYPLGRSDDLPYSNALEGMMRRMLRDESDCRPDPLVLPYLIRRECKAAKTELRLRGIEGADRPLPEWAFD